MNIVEARLSELGYELPAAPPAVGAYLPALRTGNTVVTSGQLPMQDGGLTCVGKVGSEVSVEDAQAAARLCALNCLAQIKGSGVLLENVARIFRVEGYVNSAPGFHDQAKVMNGASDFFADVFGEVGRHTRIAVGASELPLNAAVEVAIWVEVTDGSYT
jgi:enamine deaminase RidA (YjgF/YER057c/UK114 family)